MDVQFSFSKFTDQLTVKGGEYSFHLLHQMHEEDQKFDANLRQLQRFQLVFQATVTRVSLMVSLILTPLPLQQYEDISFRGKILLVFYRSSTLG